MLLPDQDSDTEHSPLKTAATSEQQLLCGPKSSNPTFSTRSTRFVLTQGGQVFVVDCRVGGGARKNERDVEGQKRAAISFGVLPPLPFLFLGVSFEQRDEFVLYATRSNYSGRLSSKAKAPARCTQKPHVMMSSGNRFKPEVAADPELSDWFSGFCVYFSDPDPESKIREKPDPESLSVTGSARSLHGLYKWHCAIQTLPHFGCIYCCRSLNRSRILNFEKIPEPDPDSKILEQERSLKMLLRPPLV